MKDRKGIKEKGKRRKKKNQDQLRKINIIKKIK